MAQIDIVMAAEGYITRGILRPCRVMQRNIALEL